MLKLCLKGKLHFLLSVFEEVFGEDSGVYLCQIEYGGIEELTVGVFSLAGMSSMLLLKNLHLI